MIRWIEWNDAPEGGDAADFFEQGGTNEELQALIESAVEVDDDNEDDESAGTSNDQDPAPCTPFWNADQLIGQQGSRLRYVPQLNKSGTWFVEEGGRWRADDDAAYRAAKAVVANIYHTATDDAVEKWAKKSMDWWHLQEMLKLAAIDSRIAALPTDFDADANLLNVANGTLDLRTATLREHRREDMISKLTPIRFDPAATSERWNNFLATVQPVLEIRTFLQKVIGSALLGRQTDEYFYFFQGPAATGKSTFLEAVRVMFGEYGGTMNPDSLLRSRGEREATIDLASLVGKRFVTASEPQEGREWGTSFIKKITGNEHVKARAMYASPFDYIPGFVLAVSGNHRPPVPAADDGFWRRCRLVPFERQIPEHERDRNLKELFRTSKEIHAAILAWAVGGLELWQHDPTLTPPSHVAEATREYRHENEKLYEWGQEALVFGEHHETSGRDLRASYERYCTMNQIPQKVTVAIGRKWGRGLEAIGLVRAMDAQGNPIHTDGGQVWRGATMKSLGGRSAA
jgi:putative DNA primase/helicase